MEHDGKLSNNNIVVETVNPDLIAKTALDHYRINLPSNKGGKPQAGREWTVYAAIVATKTKSPKSSGEKEDCEIKDQEEEEEETTTSCWVVSCATGSKCTAVQNVKSLLPPPKALTSCIEVTPDNNMMDGKSNNNRPSTCGSNLPGMVLHDSHAEVLARRGLLNVFWSEIEHWLHNYPRQNLQTSKSTIDNKVEDECGKDDEGPPPQEIIDDSKVLLEPIFENDAQVKDKENNDTSKTSSSSKEKSSDSTTSTATKTLFSKQPFNGFRLKSNVKLHLYVSDSPCGDSSIYEIQAKYNKQQEHDNTPRGNDKIEEETLNIHENGNKDEASNSKSLNFTGAKIILPNKQKKDHDSMIGTSDESSKNKQNNLVVLDTNFIIAANNKDGTRNGPQVDNDNNSNNGTINPTIQTSSNMENKATTIHIAREVHQQTAALRLKSSRSNIPDHLRSTSMSCSDKVCRWVVLGLQGSGLLTFFLPEMIHLTSVVVSRDPRVYVTHNSSSSRHNEGGTNAIDANREQTKDDDDDDVDVDDVDDGQKKALERAIVSRAKMVAQELGKTDHDMIASNILLPQVFIVEETFTEGKTVVEKLVDDQNTINDHETNSSSITPLDQSGNEVDQVDKVNYGKRKGVETMDMTQQPTKKQRIKKKKSNFSPCGISLNWQQQSFQIISSTNEKRNAHLKKKKKGNNSSSSKGRGGSTITSMEKTIGAKGIQQGKKPKSIQDLIKSSSRLCRWSLLQKSVSVFTSFFEMIEMMSKGDNEDYNNCHIQKVIEDVQRGQISYQEAKNELVPKNMKRLCDLILCELESSPLCGWVRNTNGDFYLSEL